MKSILVKVWVGEHQYRIFDTADNPTVAKLKDSLAFRLDVKHDLYDLVLELTNAENCQTRRILEDGENIEKVLSKCKKIKYKIIWYLKGGDAGISGPTAVKHEGHIGLGAKGGIEYRNLPPNWMAIFQALDEKLKSMGEGAMTQVEIQYLIKECASISLN